MVIEQMRHQHADNPHLQYLVADCRHMPQVGGGGVLMGMGGVGGGGVGRGTVVAAQAQAQRGGVAGTCRRWAVARVPECPMRGCIGCKGPGQEWGLQAHATGGWWYTDGNTRTYVHECTRGGGVAGLEADCRHHAEGGLGGWVGGVGTVVQHRRMGEGWLAHAAGGRWHVSLNGRA